MSQDLFNRLLATGGPEQKTIIFCVSDRHCDLIVNALNNLYSQWCAKNKRPRQDDYAFKCTASVNGSKLRACFLNQQQRQKTFPEAGLRAKNAVPDR
jgi:type I restriction enzyme R subunit